MLWVSLVLRMVVWRKQSDLGMLSSPALSLQTKLYLPQEAGKNFYTFSREMTVSVFPWSLLMFLEAITGRPSHSVSWISCCTWNLFSAGIKEWCMTFLIPTAPPETEMSGFNRGWHPTLQSHTDSPGFQSSPLPAFSISSSTFPHCFVHMSWDECISANIYWVPLYVCPGRRVDEYRQTRSPGAPCEHSSPWFQLWNRMQHLGLPCSLWFSWVCSIFPEAWACYHSQFFFLWSLDPNKGGFPCCFLFLFYFAFSYSLTSVSQAPCH